MCVWTYRAAISDDSQRQAYRDTVIGLRKKANELEAQMECLRNGLLKVRTTIEVLEEELFRHGDEIVSFGVVRSQFVGLTVREAIKLLFSNLGDEEALSSADITARLEHGGIRIRGEDSLSNVSAVLSQMASRHREVERLGGGKWRLVRDEPPVDEPRDFDGPGGNDVPFQQRATASARNGILRVWN
jgi:hypothetical protein